MSNNEIRVGSKVQCINPDEMFLTYGELYVVEEIRHDDNGEVRTTVSCLVGEPFLYLYRKLSSFILAE